MYNANIPSKAELPSTAKLIKSTLIAMATAGVLLVTVVLPAEYAIDPTGIGNALGLTEMGEIKTQLAAEAEADRAADRGATIDAAAAGTTVDAPDASEAKSVPGAAAPDEAFAGKADEMRVTLKPNEGAEVKLVMERGAKANYKWTVVGGEVNADLHGDGGGNAISYGKKRGLSSDEGTVTAAFTGNHGWFWRNRGDTDVVVILKVNGAYGNIKRVA